MSITIGGTQSSGTSTALTPAGQDQSGRYRFALPTHTALNQRLITVGVKTQSPTKNDLGFVEETIDLSFANAEVVEGSALNTLGGVYVNLKIRRSMNQPDSVVDEILDVLQGIAYSSATADGVNKGLVTFS